jgi:hypothetical protein
MCITFRRGIIRAVTYPLLLDTIRDLTSALFSDLLSGEGGEG